MADLSEQHSSTHQRWWIRLCHLLWQGLRYFWSIIVVGLVLNIVAPLIPLEDVIKWIVQNLLIAVPLSIGIILLTLITGTVDRIHSVVRPIIKQVKRMLPYGVMVVLIGIAIVSLLIPVSLSTVAITLIPLGMIACILLLILFFIQILSWGLTQPSKTGQDQHRSTNIMSRRSFLRLTYLSVNVGVAIASGYLIARLQALLALLFPPPIIVTVIYSTEKEGWLRDARDKFNRTTRAIQVDLVDERGSLDAVEKILEGVPDRPTVWSPASFLELHLLSTKWKQKYPDRQEIVTYTDPSALQGIVHSPLVFAIWQSRANVLSNALTASPPYNAIDWPNIHDILLLKNWSKIHGDSSWGEVKFGQTQPDLSNSGLLAITLMAYAYFNDKESKLEPSDIADPQFQKFFDDIENKVWCFGPSTGTFMDTVIQRGPSGFDIITTYENLVLTRESEATRRHEPLLMFYPSLNIISDHPFAILQGEWVKPAQRSAAQQFLNFLSSPDQQKRALAFGFRPSQANVNITDPIPGNRFLGQPSFLQNQIKSEANLQPLAQTPSGETIDVLVTLWRRQDYSTRAC